MTLACRKIMWFWYTLTTSIQMLRGRWFVFQGLPFWYVVKIAAMEKDGIDDIYDNLITAAEEELAGRVSNLEKAAAAIGEAMKDKG